MLQISAGQIQELGDAAAINHALHTLRETFPSARVPEKAALEPELRVLLAAARELGAETVGEFVRFCALAWILGSQFSVEQAQYETLFETRYRPFGDRLLEAELLATASLLAVEEIGE